MIKINNENDIPAPRTDPSTLDRLNLYGGGWESISKLNGASIADAVNSNGQRELVLTDPLITRSANPDNGSFDTGIWITVVGPDGKPLYILAGQQTAGLVMLMPKTQGNQDIFEPVPPDANALDFGKVSFQNTPLTTALGTD